MMTRAQYMAAMADIAIRFVAAVHDDGPDAASAVLKAAKALPAPDGVDPDQALMTVLAAMVDPTRTKHQLLAWVVQSPARALARLRHRHEREKAA